jgi:hypothetical protein
MSCSCQSSIANLLLPPVLARSCPRLTHLSATHCGQLAVLFEDSWSTPALQHLNLFGCRALHQVHHVLRGCSALASLNVNGCTAMTQLLLRGAAARAVQHHSKRSEACALSPVSEWSTWLSCSAAHWGLCSQLSATLGICLLCTSLHTHAGCQTSVSAAMHAPTDQPLLADMDVSGCGRLLVLEVESPALQRCHVSGAWQGLGVGWGSGGDYRD